MRPQSVKDFECLYETPTDDDGNPLPNLQLQAFEEVVQIRLEESGFSVEDDNTTFMYQKFCDAVTHAVDTVLPTVKKTKGMRRKVSKRTKALYERRTNMKGTKADYAEVQTEIKESSLEDFKSCASEWADDMEATDKKGNTRKIYNAVSLRGGYPPIKTSSRPIYETWLAM